MVDHDKATLSRIWDYLRSSLWPIPLLMLVGAALLIQGTRALDELLSGSEALQRWWLHSGNGDDARNLLSTLASSIITISTLVLSLTIVALSLAANQYGSRLVRAHMRDPRTKACIGLFLLTIVFCLLGLRLVSKEMSPADVPHVTVTVALVLGVACVVVLIFFLHMVARSIIADEVIRRVALELQAAVAALPDADASHRPSQRDEPVLPPDLAHDSRLLRSGSEGYVQEIRYERIAALAEERQLVVCLHVAAGDYMCRGGWLGQVHPAGRCPDDVLHALGAQVVLGPKRTPVQDLAYPIRHLVDVALRALSPGINDANTALVVIDRLRGTLATLMGKSLPRHAFRGAAGQWVLVGQRRGYDRILADAFRPIHDAAARQPWVVVALLDAYGKLAEHARDTHQAEALRRQARLLLAQARLHSIPAEEGQRMEHALAALEQKLQQVASHWRTAPDQTSALHAAAVSTAPLPRSPTLPAGQASHSP